MKKSIFFLKKDLINLFPDNGEGKEKERERNISVWLPHTALTGDLAHNPGMCPDREPNWCLCGLQAGGAQSTELHQPGEKKKA